MTGGGGGLVAAAPATTTMYPHVNFIHKWNARAICLSLKRFAVIATPEIYHKRVSFSYVNYLLYYSWKKLRYDLNILLCVVSRVFRC